MAALSSSGNGTSTLLENATNDHAVQIMSNFGGFGCQTVWTTEMDSNAGDVTEVLQDLQGSIHFVIKKLKPSHVADDTVSARCSLMMPVRFVKEHRDKFERIVTLRSRVCTEPSTVWLNSCRRLPRSPEIKFGKGWKAFATRNELSVGDSLIFRLKGVSEFEVYVFHKTSSAISSSQNGICNPSAGHQLLASERISGAAVDALSGWIAKKRKAGGGFVEQDSVSVEIQRRESENSHELQLPSNVDESAQNTGSGEKLEEFQESEPSLPSFIQRLAVSNVQDSAGNTCGACFEIPFGFMNSLQSIQLLDQGAHVQLQGIQEESPIRTVTCAFKITQQDMEEYSTRASSLSLGWGDFVRENDLRAGQELVFTLAAASFFVVREVCG